MTGDGRTLQVVGGPGADARFPNGGRMYGYPLGGKDNFAAGQIEHARRIYRRTRAPIADRTVEQVLALFHRLRTGEAGAGARAAVAT